jgi:hypothetical protein
VLIENVLATIPINLTLICAADDKTKKPINMSVNSTIKGTFEFDFNPMAEFDLPVNCTISSAATPQLMPNQLAIQLKEPGFTMIQNYSIEYNYTNALFSG